LSRCLENKQVYAEEFFVFIFFTVSHRHSLNSVSTTIKLLIEELNI